jgi:hypothetical protein
MSVGQNLPFAKMAKQINCRDATADQILAGWCELFAAIEAGEWSDTPLQQNFRNTLGNTAVSVAKSRVADTFLIKNPHLF